jgi:DNA-binding CsgD family transcriptional regulator
MFGLEDSLEEAFTSDSLIRSSTSSSPVAVPSTGGRPRSLVGRQDELAVLEQLLETARNGGSGTLVLHGDPGVGKSALLDELVSSASGFRIARAAGVEGEVDLPYAGLQQLCRPMLDVIGDLPPPQRDALNVAFGLSSGEIPDRYLVGLASLSLFSETATTQPLLCILDDAQWLDTETVQALAFVARRLGADTVALAIASREHLEDLEGLPALRLDGLASADARALLDAVVTGHLDGAVRERFLAETHGNPLAILELPHALTPAEAATGILYRAGDSLSSRIEDGFRHRLESLQSDTRLLLVLAAAEPLGDPLLLHRAASHLGIAIEAADAAEEAGLLEIRERTSFHHPLVRSAAYRSATQRERRLVHGALAEATDGQLDPDRKAWHRAQARAAPDEVVAAELERTAARAESRGGLAAAGAFLERAAILTPDGSKRAERALAAAEVMYKAGAYDAVESLLHVVDSAQLDELRSARSERLHAQVALALGDDAKEAIVRLLAAAGRLTQLDPDLGHTAQLEALRSAFYFANPGVLTAVADAMDQSSVSGSGAVGELILRGWAEMIEHGYPKGRVEILDPRDWWMHDLLREATIALRKRNKPEETNLSLLEFNEGISKALWDIDSRETLACRAVQFARDSGALSMLPRALAWWANVKVAEGEFRAAEAAFAEAEAIAEATHATHDWDTTWFDALHFDEAEALTRIDVQERNVAGPPYHFDYARAVAHNGAGRYEAALEAAQRSCDRHPIGRYTWALVELVEAAARCGKDVRGQAALELLTERTQLAGTQWALGLQARCTALVTDDPVAAEPLYRQATEHLSRTRARPAIARAHLLYGEWLRRESRRVDAREQLRTAHEMFTEMGIPGFAERARRELAATGETVRKRTADARDELTPQEAQIARLASERLTNPEIAAQLYLSHRTVEYHLRKVFAKLGISSRRELHTVMSV